MEMHKATILLVEDNPDEIELAQLGFARLNGNYQLQIARSGEEALDFLAEVEDHKDIKPALILLDISLPGITGLALLERLRQWSSYRHTPTVMLSNSNEQVDIGSCYRLGANSYLRKPVDFGDFAEQLQLVTRYWLETNVPATS